MHMDKARKTAAGFAISAFVVCFSMIVMYTGGSEQTFYVIATVFALLSQLYMTLACIGPDRHRMTLMKFGSIATLVITIIGIVYIVALFPRITRYFDILFSYGLQTNLIVWAIRSFLAIIFQTSATIYFDFYIRIYPQSITSQTGYIPAPEGFHY